MVRRIIPLIEVVNIVDPLDQVPKVFLFNKESSDPFNTCWALNKDISAIIEYSESAYLNLYHIFYTRARSIYEKSMI